MKKAVKIGFLTIFLFIVTACLGVYYVFFVGPLDKINPVYLIPPDAVYFFEVNKPISSWKTVSQQPVWQHLSEQPYFKNITKDTDQLTEIINENELLFEIIGEHTLLISAHLYTPKAYDFLFILDLDAISKLNLFKKYISLFLGDDYNVTNRNFEGQKILEIRDKHTQDIIYLTFIKNLVLISYRNSILEATIQESQNPTLGRDLNFIQVNQKVDPDALMNVYVNYKYLDDFLKLYMGDNPNFKALSQQIAFSGLDFSFKEDNLFISNGYTNIHDSIFSYLKIFKDTDKGKITAPSIIPQNTSFYLSLTFDNYSNFFEKLEKALSNDPERYETYAENKTKIEGFLDISLKDDFVNWIGQEIAIIQLPPNPQLNQNQYALIFKAKNRGLAREKLNLIGDQIKKKTPVLFKRLEYRGYPISFLSIKGFFKVFLGKLFTKFDKPYLTYIEDFVVFSNHPYTIKQIIDQYIAKQTLEESQNFKTFFKNFKKKSQVFGYIHTPDLYQNINKLLSRSTWQQVQHNQNYILCFENIGLQLVSEDDIFKTKFIIQYRDIEEVRSKNKANYNDLNQVVGVEQEVLIMLDSILDSQEKLADEVIDISNILPEDFNAKKQQTFYENGQIKEEVRLKDGLKHGQYFEYYEDGKLKRKGRYQNNEKVGVWKNYSPESKVVEKKKY